MSIAKKTLKTLEFDKVIELLVTEAQSGPGKAACADLTPSTEITEVRAALAETDDAVSYVLEFAPLPLGGINPIGGAVRMAAGGAVLEPKDLLQIASFLRAVKRLKSLIPESERRQPTRLVFERLVTLVPLSDLLSAIEKAIVSEDEISDHASPLLFSIRRRIVAAQDEIKTRLEQLIRKGGDALQEAIVTLRGDRYVVPVKASHKRAVQGIVHDTSSSGQTVFIEPMGVVEKNNEIRELRGQERDEIYRILSELSAVAGSQEHALILNAEMLKVLDFSMAKAKLALKMKAMPPVLNTNGRLKLKSARHPLIDPKVVVPIDFALGGDIKTVVITGPNTGGKTVSLKTCGLLSLMAMAGLLIPAAEHCDVPVWPNVLADIGEEQSIEQSLSTFSAHMRHIVDIERDAEEGALVLLDELGAGTDPSEGAALAVSILDTLLRRGTLTIATTHYKELKGYALNTDGVVNASCEFDLNTLRPTYHLLFGVPGVSQAFAISKRLGLPDRIIEDAAALISDEGARFEEMVGAIRQSHLEAKRMEEEIENLKKEAKAAEATLRAERKKAEREAKALLAEAREKASELYESAREDVESTLAELKGKASGIDHKAASDIRGRLNVGQQQLGTRQLKGIGDDLEIKVGMRMTAPAMGTDGIVEEIDAKGIVTLNCGQLTLKIKKEDLIPYVEQKPARKTKPQRSKTTATSKSQTIQSEIKLIGKTVVEAIAALDHYVDDATLSGLNVLRIVHGKGTGALRAAVAEYLDGDRRIKSYRLGGEGEGGDGVTIATLK
ncbi:MAG TPA: endonuclease MutS2 [Fastidiosipila sp.]|nr:endonuclease MutS2 [Fastidiosipila sp.]